MKKPSWMMVLEDNNIPLSDYHDFCRQLLEASPAITCHWNSRKQTYQLMRVPKTGPTVLIYNMGALALGEYIHNRASSEIVAIFDAKERRSQHEQV